MSKVTGYFNNLILADRELGKLRRAMEESGEWDKTWVILSADHSWRESQCMTARSAIRACHLSSNRPGANDPVDYTQQFNTVLTHDLILAILRGEVTNEQNIARLAAMHIIGTGR